MDFVIPNEYTVGGQRMVVSEVDRLPDNKLGACCIGAGYVKIANEFDDKKQSETSKKNTFVHEVVHSILGTMGRDDLSGDEAFVSTLSSFATEVILSMK